MGVTSALDLIKENTREERAEDSKFLQRILYFFELRVPPQVSPGGESIAYLFPLIIPPESYTMDEPFAAEVSLTQGAGVYIEENGIVQRTIHLRGTTGFKPRRLQSGMKISNPAMNLSVEKRSYSRQLPTNVFTEISGQKHFQYLQDSVFRTYGDLKRDPSTALDTQLIFHNPKDDEHWLVAPLRFTLERSVGQRFLYYYSIDLQVLDKAESIDSNFSEDKSLLDELKDAISTVKNAVDMISGAINDITAAVAEFKGIISNVFSIVDSCVQIMNAAADFYNGVSDLINLPLTMLQTTMDEVDGAIENLNNAWENLANFGGNNNAIQKFRQLQDGLEMLGITPSNWETPEESAMAGIKARQASSQVLTQSQKDNAVTATTLDAIRNLGTAITTGEVMAVNGAIKSGSGIQQFKSAKEVPIEEGDTLVSLAAKHLKDARLWQYIALVNGLKPPFTDKQANAPLVGSSLWGLATGADERPFSNALGVGSKILIPSQQRSPRDMPVLPVLGVRADASAEEHFLGTDLKLEVVSGVAGSSNAIYDVPIDAEHGSVDLKLVSGKDNLSQAVVTRLTTERGADLLYKKLGMSPVIGLGLSVVDLEMARFRLMEAVAADPRISLVGNVIMKQVGDQLSVEFDAQVRGYTEVLPVRVTV